MIAAPMFHSWGGLHLSLGDRARLDDRAAPPLRSRGDARRWSPSTSCQALAVVPVMLQRILELEPETIAEYDTSSLRDHRGQRLRAAGRAGDQGDGRVRRRPLQPLRLDRGRLGDDRDAGRPARRCRAPPAAAVRHRRQALRRARPRGAPRARPAGSSSATSRRFDGYTGGGDKEMIDGLMSHRRRRPLRRGAAVRRRPRRRHDRLGRRERLPARGRGPARRATTASTRSRSSASPTSSSASA